MVKINGTESGEFEIGKGVRQRFIMSPLLFNIYSEHIMRKALADWKGAISIGGRYINNLRYADDTTIITASKEELEELMKRIQEISIEYSLM